ncbi:hypothetical protein N3K66_006395 [Trichothecium roseum]|uniref:Uncharacterized protein n=1 Tax=Trichothecium roseum TaxID=47278 RepID=A0ACC0UX05_9HYPO|nr:hypothetical protein N3K66_006395 [Trichothecium roseum]
MNKVTSIKFRQWAFEIWSLVGVLATFAALCAMLAAFDGRAVFEWKSITLNTIVSTLAVVMKALLLFTTAECIGQWKWILFCGGQRTLMDFERIDLASRGPLGSFYLAWRKNTPFILRLGTIVTVLTIAVDPFSQQLVQLSQTVRYVSSAHGKEATTLRAQNYTRGYVENTSNAPSKVPGSGPDQVTMAAFVDPSMHGAILSGLSQSSSLVEQQMTVTCPTGNCTFDAFSTLGVCNRCTDVTSRLEQVGKFGEALSYQLGFLEKYNDYVKYKDNATGYVLPNGHFLGNMNGCPTSALKGDTGQAFPEVCSYVDFGVDTQLTAGSAMEISEMTAYGTGNPNKTVTMQDLDTMIWSTSVIYMDEIQRDQMTSEWADSHPDQDPRAQEWNYWPGSPVVAKECALYYCVKSIKATLEGNSLYETSEEVLGAVRKPGSWEPTREITTDSYAVENIPDDKIVGLEFDPKYSHIEMDNLVLHDPQAPGEADFALSPGAVWSISSTFQNELLGRWTNETGAMEMVRKVKPNAKALYNGSKTGWNISPPSLAGIWYNSHTDMKDRFDAIATSMTNDMRRTVTLGGDKNTLGRITVQNYTESDDQNPPVKGKVGVTEIHYRMEWYWIALHAVIMLAGITFCGLTMVKSDVGSNVPAWKSSSLAALSQGSAVEKTLSRARTMRDLEEMASKESIRMNLDQKMSFNPMAETAAVALDSTSFASDDVSSRTGRASLVSEDDRGRTDRTRVEEV